MMIFVESTGVNMAFQILLLIIDRRGVSIMSGLLLIRRVAHLRVYDDRFGVTKNMENSSRKVPSEIGVVPK
jgi:hypothetical protein